MVCSIAAYGPSFDQASSHAAMWHVGPLERRDDLLPRHLLGRMDGDNFPGCISSLNLKRDVIRRIQPTSQARIKNMEDSLGFIVQRHVLLRKLFSMFFHQGGSMMVARRSRNSSKEAIEDRQRG